MNKVKLPSLNPEDLQVLSTITAEMLKTVPSDLREKCAYACLAEFYAKVTSKLILPAPKNKLSMTMAQAAAFVHAYQTRINTKSLNPYAYSTLAALTEEMHRQLI